MKRNRLLLALLVSCTCWADSVTYRVTENAAACTEVRIPKWTPPVRDGDRYWPVGSWGCEYDVRSAGGASLYLGLSCGSTVYWRMKEKYVVDLNNPQGIHPIDEGSWEASTVLEPWKHYGNPASARFPPSGMEYEGHLYPKSGSNWDMYGKALPSPGRSRVAVYSYDGIVQRSYEPSFGPQRFDGTYWTEIYDVASTKRLIQIRGGFHGVDLTEFQGKSYWLGGRFFVEPLGVHGMRRVLICDVDAAAKSRVAAETDAPVPLSRAKPYLNHSRSDYGMARLSVESSGSRVTHSTTPSCV